MLHKAMTESGPTYGDIVDALYDARSNGRDPARVDVKSLDGLLNDGNMVEVPDAPESASDRVAGVDINETDRNVLITEDGTVFDL